MLKIIKKILCFNKYTIIYIVNANIVFVKEMFLFYQENGRTNCAFTPQAARASKWPEVIHFQCEPAASSGESGAVSFGR